MTVYSLDVHLTSHSRMSGSRWAITPSWLSWSWRSFLYSSSWSWRSFFVQYSCHLLKCLLLLLLLSRFSHVRLCATPETAVHEAPRPWDSSGKNTGVGFHFLLQCMKVKSENEVAQSCPTLRPHGLQPTRLLCPWDFPGKSTGVGSSNAYLLINSSNTYWTTMQYSSLGPIIVTFTYIPTKFEVWATCYFKIQMKTWKWNLKGTVVPWYLWGTGSRIPKSTDAQVLYIKWSSTMNTVSPPYQ